MTYQRKRLKYGNKITEVDGIKFRSQKEADRYGALKLLQRGKVISKLELQPRFPLIVDDVKVGLMVADFSYSFVKYEHAPAGQVERLIVEDVKGAKTLLWKLKWALAKVLYPHIDWRIT